MTIFTGTFLAATKASSIPNLVNWTIYACSSKLIKKVKPAEEKMLKVWTDEVTAALQEWPVSTD